MEKRASPQQFMILLEFMERHGDLSRPPPGLRGRIKTEKLWTELTELLNSTGEFSVQRTNEKWKRVWSDWKNKTKKKASVIKKYNSGIGRGLNKVKSLSSLEERLLQIIRLNSVTGNDDGQESGFEVPIITESSALEDMQDTCDNLTGSQPQREGTPTSRSAFPYHRVIQQRRRRRYQTTFERATAAYTRISESRLKLEEMRLINEHERETERLRLESLRIGIEERRNDILQGISVNLMELLSQIISN